jgi:hypothetical protein
MIEDRLTGPAAPPPRTLLHRGLPEPLPPRSIWPSRMAFWLPLAVVLMLVTPVSLLVLLDDQSPDRPSPLPIVLALLAGFGVIGYELLGVLRRRRRRGR